MSTHPIIAIPAFNDNYIWAILHPGNGTCMVIDPGSATPVLQFCQTHQLTLTHILITHKHWDHTDGIAGIIQHNKVPVYAPAADHVAFCDHPVTGGNRIHFPDFGLTFEVIDLPGHTRGHIAYKSPHWVFTGDTLFAGGCGRLFEGTPAELYHALQTLAALDPATAVFCGHEYTEKNLRFASLVEPSNKKITARLAEVEKKRLNGLVTLPSTIQLERETNPFLRCEKLEIRQQVEKHCGHSLPSPLDVFAALRQWKDAF